MTNQQWESERIRIQCKITRLTNKSKANIALKDKLTLRNQVKILQKELHEHKLNYFDLVTES